MIRKNMLHLLEKCNLLFLWVFMLLFFFLILFYSFPLFPLSTFWYHPCPHPCTYMHTPSHAHTHTHTSTCIAPWEILSIRKKRVINLDFPLSLVFNSKCFKCFISFFCFFLFFSYIPLMWPPYLYNNLDRVKLSSGVFKYFR